MSYFFGLCQLFYRTKVVTFCVISKIMPTFVQKF